MASRMVRSPKTLRKMYPLSPLAVTYSRDSTVQRFIQSEKHSENGYYTISATFMKMDAHGNLVPIHTWIAFDYLCTMAAASYMTDALQFDKAGHVLSIGLGGASLDMFFHARQPRLKITVVELDPTMEDLARKWFGAVEDERRRTVIGDGAEFVRKAAEEGAKYDVIALDACDTADEVFRCPAKVFYEAETMRSMREALTEKGILVMNLLSSNTTILRTTVKQHFPACFLAHMNNDNLVVACAKKAPQEPVMEKFKGALKALGLGNRVGYVAFERI